MYSVDLHDFRDANKMTQQDLADYFGVGQGFISQIERGQRPVPKRFISKILADKDKNSSMVQTVPAGDEITMSREVFDKISQLIETVSSQQGTISHQNQTISNLVEENQRLSASIKYPPTGEGSANSIVSDIEEPYKK